MSNNQIPYPIHNTQNAYYNYHCEQLYNILYALFDIDDLPANWDANYIKQCIFELGYIGFFKNTKYGDLPVQCYIMRYNYMYKPAQLAYSNYILGEGQGVIGKDCELVYMRPNFTTLINIVSKHAMILANIDASLVTNLYNSRVAHIFYADNKEDAHTIKAMYDKVTQGNPMTLVTKRVADSLMQLPPVFNNVKNTFIGDMLVDLYRTQLNLFLDEIAIDNCPIDKRERLTTAEATSNNELITAGRHIYKRNLDECFKRVNAMFGTTIKIKILEDSYVFNTDVAGHDVSE